MGIFEKRRAAKFFTYVQNYDESNPVTHEGMDLTKVPTRELIKYAMMPYCSLFLLFMLDAVGSSTLLI